MSHCIVILIDHKTRDLPGAALIAHHLQQMGVEVHLEPLESWRSCLYAWKPDFILFNHILHEHIHKLALQLHQWGVVVGCHLNEGLCQSDSIRKYLSEPQFPDLYCDLFLAWNTPHRDALVKAEFTTPPENAITIGVPRFDFYREPWCHFYEKPRTNKRIRLLFNTTFALAPHYQYSQEERDELQISLGGGKVPEFSDHNQMIKDHYNGRAAVHKYLEPLIQADCFEITLRPHPREDLDFYEELLDSIDLPGSKHVTLDRENSIFGAIINSDIILNCEDCTTSIESWIAKKPTITLLFEQSPVFFTEFFAKCSPHVDDPADLIPMIHRELEQPDQPDYSEQRQSHLDTWLYRTDGQSSQRAAIAIKDSLDTHQPTPKYPFSLSGIRRGLKLKLLQLFDEPSHTQLKDILRRLKSNDTDQIDNRYRDYEKAIRPSDVTKVLAELAKISDSESK